MIKLRCKRGIGWTAVVSILLLAVALVMFFPFIEGFINWIAKGGDTASCKLSLLGGKPAKGCLEEAKIFKEKAEIDGKKFIERGSLSTQDMAKEAIAKLLVMCLNKGGGVNSRSFTVENWRSTETVCLECFKVTLDEEVPNIRDFTDYLTSTKIKGIIPEKTYLQTLTKDNNHLQAYMEYGAPFGLSPSKGTFEFVPFKEYTIFFIGLKKGYIPRKAKELWNVVTLSLFELVFLNQDTYFAYVSESEKIPQVCDRKVN